MNQIKTKKIVLILVFLILLNSATVFGVEDYINFIQLNGEGDLFESTVNDVIQDHDGFMWFGTNNGLNKYDGYTFKSYKHIPFDDNTLADNYITSLEQTKEGYLWVGSNKGLTLFDTKNNSFKHYNNYNRSDKSIKISSDKITSILKDSNGELWVGTEDGGLNKYNKDKDYFAVYEEISIGNSITTLYEDTQKNLWIGTRTGLKVLNLETKKVETYISTQDENSLSGNHITSICEDKYGNIWVGTLSDGISKIDLKNKDIKKYYKDNSNSYSLGSDNITSIIKDKYDTIWIATIQGGLAKYDDKKDLFIKRVADKVNEYSIVNNNIMVLYEDMQGLIWAGMEGEGISKFNPQASFYNYKRTEKFENDINDNNILSVYKDSKGIVWIGTKDGGVNRLDFDKKTVDYYTHDANDSSTISSNTVNHIMEDSKGDLWISTENGLNVFNKETESFKKYFHNISDLTSINNNAVTYVLEDSNKDIWIATENGLNKYHRDNDEFIQYDVVNSGLSGNQITTIYEDSDKNIWVGTFRDGLNRYDKEHNKFINYKNKSDDTNTISNDHIQSIAEDNNGNLWIGTANGLNKFDKKTEQFKAYTEKNKLKSNFICGLLVDNDNNLWISSNNGVSKFSLRNEKVVKDYSFMDGLQGNLFNSAAVFKSSDGELLFGGTRGLNTIYPDKEESNINKPKIFLSHFSINENIIDLKEDEEVELDHNQNRFYFEFNMIDFKKTSDNRFLFKLEGYDKGWNSSNGKNHATYNNLKPGKYKLKIKGANSDGIWNEEGIEYKIRIKAPFWKTKSAILIYIITLIVITYIVMNYVKILEKMVKQRTQELNNVNLKLKETISENEELFKEKMEVEKFRSDFFVNLSHELRTPLNMILSTVQLSEMYLKDIDLKEVVTKLQNNFKLVSKNCYRLLKTVNNIVDVSKIENKQYNLNMMNINIIYLVEDVAISAMDYANHKNIQLIFDTEIEEAIVRCDPVEIERAVLNILSNSIKYTEKDGHIWVNTFIDEDVIKISVKDDGIGISKENQDIIFEKFRRVSKSGNIGSGIGLSLTKLLVNMHEGSIYFTSKLGKGSEFIIEIPIHNLSEEETIEIYEIDKESSEITIEMS